MSVDRSEGPTAEQEVEHLAGQCTALLRENERFRRGLENARWWLKNRAEKDPDCYGAMRSIDTALGLKD